MRELYWHSESYIPVFEEAAVTAVKTRRDEDDRFALTMLEKCYISGDKFICPYEESDTPNQVRRPLVQIGDQHFLLIFTSSEEALKYDCMKVMERSVIEVVHTVCSPDEDFPLDGLAVNLYPAEKNAIPYIVLKRELQKIEHKCKTAFEQFIIPQMMQMRSPIRFR